MEDAPDKNNEKTPETKNILDGKTEEKKNLTMTTKLSTDHLICKSPHESPSVSLREMKNTLRKNRLLMFLGTLQAISGFLMMIFGILVIVHKASLSQFGGGVWGGLLAMATGISGILAAAETCCPFKSTAQKVVHTVFLALSLISLAVSQLVLVIAATGLARDINNLEVEEMPSTEAPTKSDKVTIDLPANYQTMLFNILLIIVSSLECIFATVAAYKSSRDICPCFRRSDELYEDNLNIYRSHAIVNSWLGKQSMAPTPIYVVTGPSSSLGRSSKISGGFPMTPIYAVQAPSSIIGYPLIPAPLGPVPSPIIPPPSHKRGNKIQKKYKIASRPRQPTPSRSRSRSRSTERQVTDVDVALTYTGLDRTIAEEFINICESKNTSLCSDISGSTNSCQSPCNCNGECNPGVGDNASNDYLLKKN